MSTLAECRGVPDHQYAPTTRQKDIMAQLVNNGERLVDHQTGRVWGTGATILVSFLVSKVSSPGLIPALFGILESRRVGDDRSGPRLYRQDLAASLANGAVPVHTLSSVDGTGIDLPPGFLREDFVSASDVTTIINLARRPHLPHPK